MPVLSNVVRIKRKPRPLKKTYQPNAPYVVRREDNDDGTITYEIYDDRPDSYRFICGVADYPGEGPYAKHDAEQIVRGLNLLVQYGKEKLPSIRDRDDD